MSEINTKLSEFGSAILDELKTEAKAILSEMIEPVRVLKDFDGVEVLTLDEAATVLRRDKQNLRDACARDEVPHIRIGRDLIFPKRTLIALLCGEWKKPETNKFNFTSKLSAKVHEL